MRKDGTIYVRWNYAEAGQIFSGISQPYRLPFSGIGINTYKNKKNYEVD